MCEYALSTLILIKVFTNISHNCASARCVIGIGKKPEAVRFNATLKQRAIYRDRMPHIQQDQGTKYNSLSEPLRTLLPRRKRQE